MGFYGNITNVNKSTFQFDKIYYTAAEMIENAASDGIFVGRYVLVDYDEAISPMTVLEAIKKDNSLLEEWSNSTIIPGYIRTIYAVDANTGQGSYINGINNIGTIVAGGGFGFYPGKPIVNEETGETTDQLYSINDLANLNGQFILCLGQTKERYKTAGNPPENIGLVIESFEYATKPELWQISVTQIDSDDPEESTINVEFIKLNEIDTLTKYQELAANANVSNNYAVNYETDRVYFAQKSGGQGIGRGYDSTVWQKVIRDGRMTYVMIAELNSVVPTFDVTVDAPTQYPKAPYYDTDTSNLYYNLHVQPSWGMRVKDVEDEPSDLNGKALYWNEAGFNKYIPSSNTTIGNKISVEPTGKSGNLYWDHGVFHENIDTYEISIMLPQIGNIISDIWDLIYGKEHQFDALGYALWNGDSKEYALPDRKFRNTNFQWDTHNGERMLIERDPITDLPRPGFNRDALDTLAGTINSIHDLMGMIIVGLNIPEQENNESAEDYAERLKVYYSTLDPNNIYYDKDNNKYYFKEKKYIFDTLEKVAIDSDDFVDINDDTFYKSESFNFINASTGKSYRGENYHLVGNNEEILEDEVYGTISWEKPTEPTISTAMYDPEYTWSISDLTNPPVSRTWTWTSNADKTKYILKTGELSVNDGGYYNLLNIREIKSGGASAEIGPKFYAPGMYYLATKTFVDADKKQLWETEINDQSHKLLPIDFDTIVLCKETTMDAALDAAGVLIEQNDGDKIINPAIGYRFLKGIEIDGSQSTYNLVDINAVTEGPTEVTNDGPLTYNESTGRYIYEFAGILESLKNCQLTPVNPPEGQEDSQEHIYITYVASKYNSNLEHEWNENQNPRLKTLKEWNEYVAAFNNNKPEEQQIKISDLILTLEEKLVPELVKPTYILDNATIVDVQDVTKVNCYTFNDGVLNQTDPSFTRISQNDIINYYSGDSSSPIVGASWFTFETSEQFIYYELSDKKAYYYNTEYGTDIAEPYDNPIGDWKRVTVVSLAGYENADKIVELTWTPKNIFIPNIYYYIDPITNEYVLADTLEENTQYYRYNNLFVEEDLGDIYSTGAIWNEAVPIPSGVSVKAKTYEWELRELPGFAERINSMHSLILEINKLLLTNDEVTRDRKTVQGAINTLNDIIDKFDQLVPSEIIMVDAYGRVHSGDWDSKQKLGYTNIGKPSASQSVPAGDPVLADNERWIRLTTTPGVAPDYKPHIKLEHTLGHSAANTTTTADKNQHDDLEATVPIEFTGLNKNDSSDSNKDVLQLYTPIIDNMGHVIGKNTETVTLPYGFKTIGVKNTTATLSNNIWSTELDNNDIEIVADNTQDKLNIEVDEWLNITSTDVNNLDKLVFTHQYPYQEVNTNTYSNKNNINENSLNQQPATDKISLETVVLDAAGHVKHVNTETVTLPYGFKTITTGEDNNHNPIQLIANNTQDDINITGDSWTSIVATNETQGSAVRGMSITHTGPVSVQDRNLNDITPAFGATFNIEDWKFDEKGHEYHNNTVEYHTVKIPGLELITHSNNSVEDTGNIITNITYDYDGTTNHKGTFTKSLDYVGNLTLTGYNNVNNGTSENDITASNTINEAIKRLEYRINALDVSAPTETHHFIASISETDGKISATPGTFGTVANSTISTDSSVDRYVVTSVTINPSGKLDGTKIQLGTAALKADTYFDLAGAAAAILGSNADTASTNTVYGAKAYAKDYADGLASNYEPAGTVSATLGSISYTPYTYDGTDYIAGTVTTKTLAQLVEIIAKLDAKLTYLENNNI